MLPHCCPWLAGAAAPAVAPDCLSAPLMRGLISDSPVPKVALLLLPLLVAAALLPWWGNGLLLQDLAQCVTGLLRCWKGETAAIETSTQVGCRLSRCGRLQQVP